jgi:hypothetical protein
MDSNVQPAALPTAIQMPPEHSESLEQGLPVVNVLAPLSDPLVESGGPESIGAPPSLMTGFDSEQAAMPPMSKSATTLRSVRRRGCLMVVRWRWKRGPD